MKITLLDEQIEALVVEELGNQHSYILRWMEGHEEDPDNNFMHNDDYVYNKSILPALELVINHYGGHIDNDSED